MQRMDESRRFFESRVHNLRDAGGAIRPQHCSASDPKRPGEGLEQVQVEMLPGESGYAFC
jgi:hypothetical protein